MTRAIATRRRSRRARRFWPAIDYYAELTGEERRHDGSSLLDELVDRTPHIRRAFRRVLAMEHSLEIPERGRRAFIRYSDARSSLTTMRDRAMFNTGVELGTICGRASVRAGRNPSANVRRHLAATLRTAADALGRGRIDETARTLGAFVALAIALVQGPEAPVKLHEAAGRLATRERRRRSRA